MNKVSCFIRKNTEELREKLRDMGYKPYIYGSSTTSLVVTLRGKTPTFTSTFWAEQKYPDFIDCGTNEELFLALAACNLPTDKGKLLIDYENYVNPRFRKCDIDHSCYAGFRIATPEEIIEHFKTN